MPAVVRIVFATGESKETQYSYKMYHWFIY